MSQKQNTFPKHAPVLRVKDMYKYNFTSENGGSHCLSAHAFRLCNVPVDHLSKTIRGPCRQVLQALAREMGVDPCDFNEPYCGVSYHNDRNTLAENAKVWNTVMARDFGYTEIEDA